MPRTIPPRKDKNRVPRAKRALPAAPKKDAERVAKVIARAGLGSRREVEEWIAEGRVAVNGAVLESPAVTVGPEDVVTVDGAPLPERERTRLFLYHKPRGVVTTNKDPEGRTTLFEILPQGLPRLVSVGRLDLNSEGLLLLTNDGGLARVLELPETGWLRRYRVRANGAVDQAQLDTLMKGTTVDGVEYGPVEAVLDRVQGANVWITVALREGKNREVRNVLGALGLKVSRLIRVSYGPFQLGEIAEGAVEEVKTRILRDQIGAELADAAGADFSGPILEQEIEEAPVRPAARSAARRGAEPAGTGAPPRVKDRTKERPAARARAMEAPVDEIAPPAGPRRRRRLAETHELETRGTVADRKGRTVVVERAVTPAGAERPSKGRSEGRFEGPRAQGRGGRSRFDDEARGERPSRGPRAERPFREGGPGRRPGRAQERPERSDEGFENRRPARGFGAERPYRSDDERRGPKAGAGRPPRGETGRGGPAGPRRYRDEEGHDRPAGAGRPARAGFGGRSEGPARGPRGPARSSEGAPSSGRRYYRDEGDAGRPEGAGRPSRTGFGGRSEGPARGPRGPARSSEGPSGGRRFRDDGDHGRPEGTGRPSRSGFGGRSEGSRGAGRSFDEGPGRGGPGGRKGPPKGSAKGPAKGGPRGYAKDGGKGPPRGSKGPGGPKGPPRGAGGRGRPGPKR